MKNGGVKLTFKPKFNSLKEVLISLVSEFIRSHSTQQSCMVSFPRPCGRALAS